MAEYFGKVLAGHQTRYRRKNLGAEGLKTLGPQIFWNPNG
jgi:hypothetical protein